jgi:hypothetical protein
MGVGVIGHVHTHMIMYLDVCRQLLKPRKALRKGRPDKCVDRLQTHEVRTDTVYSCPA